MGMHIVCIQCNYYSFKELTKYMNKIITLDIEASGLGTDSYPIEVGFVLDDGNSWCSLIKPEADWMHWSEEAESIHQISKEAVFEHGKSVKDIATTLNEKLNRKTVYSDCSVLDGKWIHTLYAKANMVPSFKLRDIMYIMKEEQFEQWEATKKIIAKELGAKRHRATNDARILQQTYYRVNQFTTM